MRFLFFIFFTAISFTSNAQDIRLFQNSWYLKKLTIDSIDYLNPKDTDGLPVKLLFYKQDLEDNFETSVCDVIFGTIGFDSINPTFSIINIGITLGGCGVFGDPSGIESDYFNFYSNSTLMTYEIIENAGVLNLTLTALNGDKAIYSEPTEIERIDEGGWILQDLLANNQHNYNPLNSQGTPIITEFGSDFFSTWICDSNEGMFSYLNFNNFIVSEVNTSLGGCIITPELNLNDVNDIEEKLFSFYDESGTFTYLITEETFNNPRKLIITDQNNETFAVYYKASLSTKYFSNISFTIYPNPVVDELLISSSENLKNCSIEIFDLLGKFKISKILKDSNSIDVQSLSKGMYLLLITDDLGNYTIKKFIK
jgi:hypothetical protein